MVTMWKLT